jgi:oxygen-independent coproporphyrinogen-3 oxidase
MNESRACYIHIPFCERKCAYCDFNSHGGYGEEMFERYGQCIIHEIGRTSSAASSVDTIFFGGGTPTAIPARLLAEIINELRGAFNVERDAEITVEANPGSSDASKFAELRAAGANRISIGVQSFDDRLLKAIERIHSADEAARAVKAAREAGFENISIDLMFGLPGQSMEQWRQTLDQAFELKTDHLSMYCLIVEDNTPFGARASNGELSIPSDDDSADMFELARAEAAKAGFEQYEISNYARPGKTCRHNLHYWRNDPYYGFGAGAVSYIDGERATRIFSPIRYAEKIERGESVIRSSETPDLAGQMGETMMLGLRLISEGVDTRRFKMRFGESPEACWPKSFEKYVNLGLLEKNGLSLRITNRGIFIASEIMTAFLAPEKIFL